MYDYILLGTPRKRDDLAYGPIASRCLTHAQQELKGLRGTIYNSPSKNRFFVLEDCGGKFVLRAAQSTKSGAMAYMEENRVLVTSWENEKEI